jgi:hypothetical protein
MEGNGSFGGRTARSSEVAAVMEREGRVRKKEEGRKKKLDRSIMYPKGASLTALLSTVARACLPRLHLKTPP